MNLFECTKDSNYNSSLEDNIEIDIITKNENCLYKEDLRSLSMEYASFKKSDIITYGTFLLATPLGAAIGGLIYSKIKSKQMFVSREGLDILMSTLLDSKWNVAKLGRFNFRKYMEDINAQIKSDEGKKIIKKYNNIYDAVIVHYKDISYEHHAAYQVLAKASVAAIRTNLANDGIFKKIPTRNTDMREFNAIKHINVKKCQAEIKRATAHIESATKEKSELHTKWKGIVKDASTFANLVMDTIVSSVKIKDKKSNSLVSIKNLAENGDV